MSRLVLCSALLALLAAGCDRHKSRFNASEAAIARLSERIDTVEFAVSQRGSATPGRQTSPTPAIRATDRQETSDNKTMEHPELVRRFRAMRHEFVQTEDQVLAVDEDLESLEHHVDRHMHRVEALEDSVEQLSGVVNSHADALDAFEARLDVLESNVAFVTELQGVLSFEDGSVVIRDADLLLIEGRRPEDGWPASNGNLIQELAPEPP